MVSSISALSVEQKYNTLKRGNKDVVLNEVPKDIDEFVKESDRKKTRNSHFLFWAGASVVSFILVELYILANQFKLSYNLNKKSFLRNAHLEAPAIFAGISLFSYFKTQENKEKGFIPKEEIYKSEGFRIKKSKKHH